MISNWIATGIHTVLRLMLGYAALLPITLGLYYWPITADIRLAIIVLAVWLISTIMIIIPIMGARYEYLATQAAIQKENTTQVF